MLLRTCGELDREAKRDGAAQPREPDDALLIHCDLILLGAAAVGEPSQRKDRDDAREEAEAECENDE